MNGQIIPGTCIAVDFWKIRGVQEQLVHFLTHLHGDHIVGLTSSWTRPIYCSEFTAQILDAHYGVSKKLMNILHLNQCTLVQIPNSDDSFCVTAYDANHCPGALMLHFEGQFGNIFHTGDFRFSKEMMEGTLHPLIGKIDKLYIDNTFCAPNCVFPSRDQCQQKITDIAKNHSDSDILIGIRKLGKECMLAMLGVELNETIFVSPERYQISQRIFDCNVFAVASKDQHARIQALPLHSITREFIYNKNQINPTIAIMPTAIFTGLDCKPFSRDPNIFVVPYSDHSSFPELVEFVKMLQPRRIIPIVRSHRGPFGKDISSRCDMSLLESYMQSDIISPQQGQSEPPLSQSDLIDKDNNVGSSKHSNSSITFSQKTALDISCGHKYFTVKSRLSSYSQDSDDLLTHSSLKRKVSFPNKRKKKQAKGVVFEEDDGESQQVSEDKLDTHSNNNRSSSNTDDAVEKMELDRNDLSLTSKRDALIFRERQMCSKNALNGITQQRPCNENTTNDGDVLGGHSDSPQELSTTRSDNECQSFDDNVGKNIENLVLGDDSSQELSTQRSDSKCQSFDDNDSKNIVALGGDSSQELPTRRSDSKCQSFDDNGSNSNNIENLVVLGGDSSQESSTKRSDSKCQSFDDNDGKNIENLVVLVGDSSQESSTKRSDSKCQSFDDNDSNSNNIENLVVLGGDGSQESSTKIGDSKCQSFDDNDGKYIENLVVLGGDSSQESSTKRSDSKCQPFDDKDGKNIENLVVLGGDSSQESSTKRSDSKCQSFDDNDGKNIENLVLGDDSSQELPTKRSDSKCLSFDGNNGKNIKNLVLGDDSSQELSTKKSDSKCQSFDGNNSKNIENLVVLGDDSSQESSTKRSDGKCQSFDDNDGKNIESLVVLGGDSSQEMATKGSDSCSRCQSFDDSDDSNCEGLAVVGDEKSLDFILKGKLNESGASESDSCNVVSDINQGVLKSDTVNSSCTREPLRRVNRVQFSSNSIELEELPSSMPKLSAEELDGHIEDELNDRKSQTLNSESVEYNGATYFNDNKEIKQGGGDRTSHQPNGSLNLNKNTGAVGNCEDGGSGRSEGKKVGDSYGKIGNCVHESKALPPVTSFMKRVSTLLSSSSECASREKFSLRQLFHRGNPRHCNEKAFHDAVAKLM